MSTLKVNNIGKLTGSTQDTLLGMKRAWASYNQVGTQALRDTLNLSSVVDTRTGGTTLNLAAPMLNSNYAIDTNGEYTAASLSIIGVYEPVPPTVSTIDVQCSAQTTALKDITYGSIGVMGDLA